MEAVGGGGADVDELENTVPEKDFFAPVAELELLDDSDELLLMFAAKPAKPTGRVAVVDVDEDEVADEDEMREGFES